MSDQEDKGSRPPPPQPMGSSRTSPITQAGDTRRRGRAGGRRASEEQCLHPTMTRVYHPNFKCAACKNPPQFGWMFRCTHDKEPLIMSAKLKGEKVGFDEISQNFAQETSLGKFGPDKRTQKYSFLREITTEQLHSYTPSQLDTILSQRDHVAEIIAESRQKACAGSKYPDDNMSWVPDEREECQYKVCQRCYSICLDKSWVSLNGVLNGDVLPTVATGYSFSFAESRPLIDVQVARNLGCRPVYLPGYHPINLARKTREGWGDDNLNDHINSWFQADPSGNNDNQPEATPVEEGDFDDSISISVSDSDESFDTEDDNPADWAPPNPEYVEDAHSDNLNPGASGPSQTPAQDHYRVIISAYSPLRPPWTPPPTPSFIMEGPFDEAMDQDDDGRSPWSLKTNSLVRTRLFSSFPTISTVLGQEFDREYKTEEMCDVGLVLPLHDVILKRACNTPLPRPDLDEEFLFVKGKISIGDFKHTQASVVDAATTDAAPAPAVIHSPDDETAVALITEESVETGVPDIVLRAEGDNEATATDLGHAN